MVSGFAALTAGDFRLNGHWGTTSKNDSNRHLRQIPRHAAIGIAVGFVCVVLAFSGVLPTSSSTILKAVGLSVTIVMFGLIFWGHQRFTTETRVTQALVDLVHGDPSVSIVTDLDGNLIGASPRASGRMVLNTNGGLVSILAQHFAEPEMAIKELLNDVKITGHAERVVRQRGGAGRLTARSLPDELVFWSISDPISDGVHDVLDTLDLPIVDTLKDGSIVWRNAQARMVFGPDTTELSRSLAQIDDSVNIRFLPTPLGQLECHITAQPVDREGRRFMLAEVHRGDSSDQQNLLHSIPLPLVELSLGGEIKWLNQSAWELLGDIGTLPVSLDSVFASEDGPVEHWLRALEAGTSASHSRVFTKMSKGKETYIQVSVSLSRQNGVPVVLGVFSDATEHKALEAQFVQGQKMQAIGQLAGGIAHDFNNLLTAISGHCDLLLLRHDQGDEDYGDLVQINQNANRAAALISQLLAFSRKQPMYPESLDLRDALSDLTHLLNRLVGEKVELILTRDQSLWPIRADKRKLEQALMNLVVNARDAMPDGGEVRIESTNLRLAAPTKWQRATLPAGDYVQVVVSDEGVGISEDSIDSIFEPFFTTKRTGEGTGLGLSTVYGIMKQSGGFIFAESVLDQGTRFTLLFPVAEAPPAALAVPGIDTPQPSADQRVAHRPLDRQEEPEGVQQNLETSDDTAENGLEGRVVLLVEDEAPVRAFAARALRLQGLSVIEAESGEEALGLLANPELLVDIFVTDVVMPGLDGPGWVETARDMRPEVPVLFVSGYNETAYGDGDLSVQNSTFLPKPFSLNQLTQTVMAQLPR